MQLSQAGTPANITATTQVYAQPCRMLGFYVNSTTGGTIVFHDHASAASAAISGTITPAIGYHPFPADLGKGLHAVIANTLNVTIFYQPN